MSSESGKFIMAVAAAIFILGTAAVPALAHDREQDMPYSLEVNDPLESVNRVFFDVNNFGDRIVLKPLAKTYRTVLPGFAQTGIRNIINNLAAPVILINDLLQGKPDRAATTAGRLLLNSTIGLGGMIDVASDFGLERHSEDFGQTLAVWGATEGPYLYLPFLGPNPPRDLVGRGVDMALDPFTWMGGNKVRIGNYARTGADLLDMRARNIENIDDIERSSIDFYAAVRSLYRQSREAAIRDNQIDFGKLPDFTDEFDFDDFD